MGELPDLEKLYGTVHSTWDKIRADIFSHTFVFCALFVVARISLPQLPDCIVDPSQVTQNPYFKLTKEADLLFLVPLVVLMAVIVYGLLVRAVGQALATILIMALKPIKSMFSSEWVRVQDLLTIAATLDSSRFTDFTETDLGYALNKSLLHYASRKDSEFEKFHFGSPEMRNASLYLGHASFFLLGWVLLFVLLPESSRWRLENGHHFWLAAFLLLIFLAWSWLREREFLLQGPASVVLFAAHMIRTDEDMKSVLAAAEPRRGELEERLRQLRQEREPLRPSLLRYVRTRTLSGGTSKTRQPVWWTQTLSSLYVAGESFATDAGRNQRYDEKWLRDYGAYIFYRLVCLVTWILRICWRVLVALLGFIINATGTSDWLTRQSARISIRKHSSLEPAINENSQLGPQQPSRETHHPSPAKVTAKE